MQTLITEAMINLLKTYTHIVGLLIFAQNIGLYVHMAFKLIIFHELTCFAYVEKNELTPR